MRYLQLSAHFKPLRPISFPPNPVNTFRGALGYKLKRVVCFQRGRETSHCHGCLAERSCIYALAFETPSNEDCRVQSGGGDIAPHPIVLDAGFKGPVAFLPDLQFIFNITLFSKAIDSLPYFILALREAAEAGLTKERVKCDILKIATKDGILVYDKNINRLEPVLPKELLIEEPSTFFNDHIRVTIEFETPTSFKEKAGGRVSNEPEFHKLIRSLLRRYSTLETFETGASPRWNYSRIIERAENVRTIENRTYIEKWERYSNRQGNRSFFGGMVGRVVFEGDIKPFLPLLAAGEIIHVGRGTIFGQGRYKVISVTQAEKSIADSNE